MKFFIYNNIIISVLYFLTKEEKMNIEFVNLNNNMYAVSNEEGQIKLIQSKDNPEVYLNMQNELDDKYHKKVLLINQINKLSYISLFKKIINKITNIFILINAILCFINIEYISIIAITILFKIIIDNLIGTNDELKNKKIYFKESYDLNEKEILSLEENIRKLKLELDYQQVHNYNDKLNYENSKSIEKPYVRKLSLKR